MEAAGNGGSDDRQLPVDLRKMIGKMIKEMVISTIRQEIVPIVESLLRKIVKEEIQSVGKRLIDSVRTNEISSSRERNLQLKFSDDGIVSDPVLTGKEIKGKGDKPMELSLVDEATGEVVICGPEASSEVEIFSLDASADDNEHTHESFNSMIIREDDDKPRFAKRTYISLKEGLGVLNDVKFRHTSMHTKRYRCRLGATIKENLIGINVQEAWTKPFDVLDNRSNLYKKRYPPSLSDEVWRLENIGKGGNPCKRLEKENIKTVKDFLFLLSVNPQSLKRIVRAPTTMWEATLDHARTCVIDDKNVHLHYPSAESNMGVIFDAVGGLKGIVNESHYVPINNLSSDEKDHAHKLLLAAFKDREGVTSFDDEASLLQKFPYRSSLSIQEDSNINKYYPTLPGTSSLSIYSYIRTPIIILFCSFESAETGQIDNPVLIDTMHSPSTSSETIVPFSSTLELPSTGQPYVPDSGVHTPICYPNTSLEPLVIVIDPMMDEVLENLLAEDRANWLVMMYVMLWCARVKKMALGGSHIQKKQKVW